MGEEELGLRGWPRGPETRTSCVLDFGDPLFPDSRDVERDPPSLASQQLVCSSCHLRNHLEHRRKGPCGLDSFPRKHSVQCQESCMQSQDMVSPADP